MTVQYKDTQGNTSMAVVVLAPGIVTSVQSFGNEATREAGITVYPNPVRDQLMVRVAENWGQCQVTISSPTGAISMQRSVHPGDNPIHVGNLPAGIYIMVLQSPSGYITRQRIIKQ